MASSQPVVARHYHAAFWALGAIVRRRGFPRTSVLTAADAEYSATTA